MPLPPFHVGVPNTFLLDSSPGSADAAAKFCGFFWPLVSRLVRLAMARPNNSAEVLDLCFDMLRTLRDAQSDVVNLEDLSNDWFDLLLGYTTFEVRPGCFNHFLFATSPNPALLVRRIRPSPTMLTLSRLASSGSYTLLCWRAGRQVGRMSFRSGLCPFILRTRMAGTGSLT